MRLSQHFQSKEFRCHCGCGAEEVDRGLVCVLEMVRERFGVPIYVMSGRRCKKHNSAVGGAETSRHLGGLAADIQVEGVDPVDVADYLDFIHPHSLGIGWYKTWTHVDVRRTKARWDNR